MKKTVYLAGAINKCTDSEAMDWRTRAKELLGKNFGILDPMDRDYRGVEKTAWKEIVEKDLEDINRCDIFLVNCQKPSWGTAMEIFYASRERKQVIGFGAGEDPSPWLIYHVDILESNIECATGVIHPQS